MNLNLDRVCTPAEMAMYAEEQQRHNEKMKSLNHTILMLKVLSLVGFVYLIGTANKQEQPARQSVNCEQR